MRGALGAAHLPRVRAHTQPGQDGRPGKAPSPHHTHRPRASWGRRSRCVPNTHTRWQGSLRAPDVTPQPHKDPGGYKRDTPVCGPHIITHRAPYRHHKGPRCPPPTHSPGWAPEAPRVPLAALTHRPGPSGGDHAEVRVPHTGQRATLACPHAHKRPLRSRLLFHWVRQAARIRRSELWVVLSPLCAKHRGQAPGIPWSPVPAGRGRQPSAAPVLAWNLAELPRGMSTAPAPSRKVGGSRPGQAPWSARPPGQGRACLGPASGGGGRAGSRRAMRRPAGLARGCGSEPGPSAGLRRLLLGHFPGSPERAPAWHQTVARWIPYPSHFYLRLPSFLEHRDPGKDRTSPNPHPLLRHPSLVCSPSRPILPALGPGFLSCSSGGVERRKGVWVGRGRETPPPRSRLTYVLGRGLGGLRSHSPLGTQGDPWYPPPQTQTHAPSEQRPRGRRLGTVSTSGDGTRRLGYGRAAAGSPGALKPFIPLRPPQPRRQRGREPLPPRP